MLTLAWKNLIRRPIRTLLTVTGLAVALALLVSLLSFGEGYQQGLRRELDGMGMQMMLVPLGCPYDAAARVLKGRALDVTLPQAALDTARADKAVAIAAPLFAATLPRLDQGRTDLWVGVDDTARQMRPWWKLTAGSTFFRGADSVLLGAEAAATELRKPGDRFYSPETGRTFTVCGVLERSGTSDDSQFFVPLATAQAMFHQTGRLTGIAIRLKDPALLKEASDRLQEVKGAQVVTVTEMMGTFLNLMGAARTLTVAIALISVTISALSIFNTMMAGALERSREIGILRAIGFGREHIFFLVAWESVMLSLVGGLCGLLLAAVGGGAIESLVRPYLPLAPENGLSALTPSAVGECLLLILVVGLVAGGYPAYHASQRPPALALKGD
jgi:putative ABC transport system permease protein